jgi:hypothetical protein
VERWTGDGCGTRAVPFDTVRYFEQCAESRTTNCDRKISCSQEHVNGTGRFNSDSLCAYSRYWPVACRLTVTDATIEQFTESAYKPANWAYPAEDMGVKYTVLTARHHNGFTR